VQDQDFGKLTREDVEARYVAGGYHFYSQSLFLVKGAVFAVAAGVFLLAFRAGQFDVERFVFFLAGCLIALIPVATYLRGVLLASGDASILDYFAPFAMGFAEVLMFYSLSARPEDLSNYKGAWYLGVGLQAVFASLLVGTRWIFTSPTQYHSDLNTLMKDYKKWLFHDSVGAGLFATTALSLSYFSRKVDELAWQFDLDRYSFGALPNPIALSAYMFAAFAFGITAVVISVRALNQQSEVGKWLRANPRHASS
jgi:hypothetical protein